MKVVKFFSKLLSCLFLLVFGVLCLAVSLFVMIRNMTSYDSVTSYVQDANIFDYSSQDIADSKDLTIRQTIEQELLKMNVPILVTDEILDSPEVSKIISDYIYNYSHYVLFNADKPVFPKEDIMNIAERVYVSYEHRELAQKQKEELEAYVTLLGDKVDKTIFSKTELNEIVSLNVVKRVAIAFDTEYIVMVLAVLIIMLFAIISLCLGNLKKAINLCGKMIVLDGVLFIVLSFVEVRILIMYFNSQGLIDNLAILLVEQGFQNMLVCGGILIGIGLLLVIISGILLKKERAARSSEVLQNVIIEEVKKSQDESVQEEKIEEESVTESEVDTNEEDNIAEKVNQQVSLEDSKTTETEDSIKGKNHDIKDETIIVPMPDENSDIKEKSTNDEEEVAKITSDDYTIINDEKNTKDETDEIVKKDIEVIPLREVEIDISHPEKGRDIEFNSDSISEGSEEIEIL